MTAIYFKFKDDVTVQEIAEILESHFTGGVAEKCFDSYSEQAKRHCIVKDHDKDCPKCGCYNDINGDCTADFKF